VVLLVRLASSTTYHIRRAWLSDEEIRIAVARRLGYRACEPHTCVCGKAVDQCTGLYGLACRRSAPRQQCHTHLNDIIWRAMKRADIPAVKEPVGLMLQGEKHPDSTTILPWLRGRPISLGLYSARQTLQPKPVWR